MQFKFQIFLITHIWVHAFDTAYLGSVKHQVQASQQFEHQFFNIPAITSIDLYFQSSPFKKVQTEDMDCFWSQQEMGLQGITQFTVDEQEEQQIKGDLLCLGDEICYITAGYTLYVVNAQQIKQKHSKVKRIIKHTVIAEIRIPHDQVKIIDFSGVGLIALLNNENQIELLDISDPLKPQKTIHKLTNLLEKSLKSSISVISNPSTYTLYVNQGRFIEFWNIEYIDKMNRIGVIYMDGIAYTLEEEKNFKVKMSSRLDNLKEMKIVNNLLFIFSEMKGVLIYDINDAFQIQKLNLIIDQEDDGSAFYQQSLFRMDAQRDQIILLHMNSKNLNYKFYHYQIIQEDTDPNSVKMQLLLSGVINIKESDNIDRIYLVYNQSALIVGEAQVTLLQLMGKPQSITTHQNTHHSFEYNLSVSQHLLPSSQNQIYSAYGQILQFHNNKLKIFQQAGENYDIFCNAPGLNITQNEKIVLKYYGLIISTEPCFEQLNINKPTSQLQSSDIISIIEREKFEFREETKCLLSFDYIIHIEKKQSRVNKITYLIVFVLFCLGLTIFIDQLKKFGKKKMITKSLQKFEELNNQLGMDTKERIRITHSALDIYEDDSEEWKALARIQQDSSLNQQKYQD